jgi:ABC-type histidine transport system ATPase subunit
LALRKTVAAKSAEIEDLKKRIGESEALNGYCLSEQFGSIPAMMKA